MIPSARLLALVAVATVALLLAAVAPAARAAGADATTRSLDRLMRQAGPASGAYAVDLDSGAQLYAGAPDTARIPASVTKLFTTATALLRFGADGHLTTRAVAAQAPDAAGVVTGDLYLRGDGDPTFGEAEARALAQSLADGGVTAVAGRVRGDESAFDARRGTPASNFRVSGWVGPLSALTFNRNLDRGRFVASPARTAAAAFTRALERVGVDVARGARTGPAPAGAVELGAWDSPALGVLAGQVNRPSDNFMAETLLKDLGAHYAGAGTTLAGIGVVRDTVDDFGARPRLLDGSGLSRRNRVSPRQVVQLLDGMAASDVAAAYEGSLPVAGRSGTLQDRMRGTAAQDRCRAKTGTLRGVSALAGYCESAAGGHVAFAFLMNGVNVSWAHVLQDRMTAALARYAPAAAPAPAPTPAP